MLDRNRRVKPHPERFQEYKGLSDVIICCEERVYVLMNAQIEHCHLVHIINMDIEDNEEEAITGAALLCQLCTMLEKSADLDTEIEGILSNFENICKRRILHANKVLKEKLRFSVVCSCNMNRSMEAHALLMKKGFNVRSFGSGDVVRLPGPSPTVHNIYSIHAMDY
ncbi:RNA polymerase II subunit A C-terminal domain phosphatase SSU72 [Trichinella pseudospiralis]|uniref:RNA polymerase II subunit A C-terminal domain phosphatase SSU72 n=1 Tax=Trichinella pseudospiralis TaxID=6337 RepID=A0A0V0XMV0_TRIPS|nr:RNA polymerase II subunit A C-terminal domain phosphatase SSU72 [Trichinella pseudospiralis]